jgi:hypothetical protein
MMRTGDLDILKWEFKNQFQYDAPPATSKTNSSIDVDESPVLQQNRYDTSVKEQPKNLHDIFYHGTIFSNAKDESPVATFDMHRHDNKEESDDLSVSAGDDMYNEYHNLNTISNETPKDEAQDLHEKLLETSRRIALCDNESQRHEEYCETITYILSRASSMESSTDEVAVTPRRKNPYRFDFFADGHIDAGGVLIPISNVLFDTGASHASYVSEDFVAQYRTILEPFIFPHNSTTLLGDGKTKCQITECLIIPCTKKCERSSIAVLPSPKFTTR